MRIKGGTHSRRINLGSPPQYTNYLLDTLRFCTGVIVAVAFQKVDHAPQRNTAADQADDRLEDGAGSSNKGRGISSIFFMFCSFISSMFFGATKLPLAGCV